MKLQYKEEKESKFKNALIKADQKLSLIKVKWKLMKLNQLEKKLKK